MDLPLRKKQLSVHRHFETPARACNQLDACVVLAFKGARQTGGNLVIASNCTKLNRKAHCCPYIISLSP